MEVKNRAHEECATLFTHSNEAISGRILASRDIKDWAKNLPSFFSDPISTFSPFALCS